MLTCPCVTMEWKTPFIQAVDVSAVSSGVRCRPVRSRWPWGLRTGRSFEFNTTWWCWAWKKESRVPWAESRSSWRQGGGKSRWRDAVSRSVHRRRGAELNSVADGATAPDEETLPAGRREYVHVGSGAASVL